MSHRSQCGRALLVLLALVAAAGVAFLLLGNPFAGPDQDGTRGAGPSGEQATRGVATDARADAATASGVGLAGRYGEGDLGAVTLRLVDVRKAPVAAKPIRILARTGETKEVATAADGVALFDAVAPGRGYRVEIAVEGFHAITVQGVNVRARETTDLGDVMLGQNVVLRGRVVDVAGAAIPDAEVQAFRPERSMALDGFLSSMVTQATAFPTPADQAVTDAEGWFTLAALPEGAWRLVARRAGYATKQESDVVLDVDRPAKTLTIVLAEGATAKGKVTDESGKAIVGARVLALRDYGMRWQPNQGLEREVARTDDRGRYLLDTLAKGGSYRFGVLADGFAPLFDAQGNEVEQVLERDFVLARGGALAITVTDRGTGEPVAGAEVTAVAGRMPMGPPRGGRGAGGGGGAGSDDRVTAALGRTDEKGTLRVEGLMPGPVAMGQVRASGYVPVTASPFMGSSWGEIVAGETLSVDLQLERGGVIEGTLQDAQSGAPIAGATVSVVPRENAWSIFMTGAPSSPTDTTGKFRIEGVRPGRYGFVAAAEGYTSPAPTEDATTVTVPEDGTVATMALKLVAAGSVEGVVKDARGEAVSGARVRARAAPPAGGGRAGRFGGGNWRAFLPGAVTSDLTDQDGRYRIEGLASGERWVLSAESDDYVPLESEPFEVASGETKTLDLLVVGGGSIQGRVVDDQGRFVEGARVQLGFLPADQVVRRNLSGFEMDRLLDPQVHFTDADGRYFASKLRPGRTLVKVEKEGFVVFYKRDLDVRADETIGNYVASLSRGEAVEGVVLDDTGRPVQNAVVAVTARRSPGQGDDESDSAVADDSVEPQMSGRSDAQGKFRVENVPPGRTYSVVVWFAPGFQGWAGAQSENAIRRDVRVPARDLEFRLLKQEAPPLGGAFPGRGGGGGGRVGPPTPPTPPR